MVHISLPIIQCSEVNQYYYDEFFDDHLKIFFNPFHSNSPYCLPYNSYNVTLENWILDQLIIPSLIFFFILSTSLLNIVLMLWGEILSWWWSLMRVNGLLNESHLTPVHHPLLSSQMTYASLDFLLYQMDPVLSSLGEGLQGENCLCCGGVECTCQREGKGIPQSLLEG